MKRKFVWICIGLLMSLNFFACQKELTSQEIEDMLNLVTDEISVPTQTSTNINLPETITYGDYEIQIEWTSSNQTYLTNSGIVYQPAFLTGNQLITLTATFTYLDISISETYEVNVLSISDSEMTYDVSFDSNGGSAVSDLNDVLHGSTITEPSNPIREGYIFSGWYKESTCITPWIFSTEIVTSDITLYAKWIAITYTVTFDSNGGSPVDSLTDIVSESLIDAPEEPYKYNAIFVGWFKEIELVNEWNFSSDIVTQDITLYAKWIPMTYTVSFEVNGGTTIIDMTDLSSGSILNMPESPVKDGYTFIGWFKEAELIHGWNFEIDQVTSDTVLYAKWEENSIVIEGTPITTAQEFNNVSNSGEVGTYYLANDIDFSTHTWTYVNFNFQGIINGNGKTLSNLTLYGTDRTGIFSRVKNTEIYNLTLDNIQITSTNRAGILVGEADGDSVSLHHIRIINSSVSGNSSNGVGGLIGYTKPGFTVDINNIIIQNTSIINASSAAGALIGMTDSGYVNIRDINIIDTDVTGSNRTGGIYGEIKGTPIISIERGVIDVHLITAQYLGGVVGRNQATSGVTISDLLITGSMTSTNKDVGLVSGDLDISFSSVYAVELLVTGTLNKQNLPETNIILSFDTINALWWMNHLSSISSNTSWYYLDQMYHLYGNSYVPDNSHAVTLVFSNGNQSQIIYVTDQTSLSEPENPTYYGYAFVSWCLDELLLINYDFSNLVTESMTLYAKWEALPTYTVTINGILQVVVANDLAIQPEDPIQLGKIFSGWFIGDDIYDFSSPVTQDLTVDAHFIDAELFTITFNSLGGSIINPIDFYENQIISNLPRPVLDNYRFVNWYIDIELTDLFEQDYIESHITLYAKYVEMGELIFDETFDYPVNTPLGSTSWEEVKPGLAIMIADQTLKLTEEALEATYEQSISAMADGRYVLVFDFMQGIGGAAFTIELLHGSDRIFTVGANRANRYTYRNSDGSETAVNASLMSVTPNLYHQAIIVFDTEYDVYKYFIKIGETLLEVTPDGGVSFMSDLDITNIRIRIVGHNNVPSTDPTSYIRHLLIESSSETENGKSIYDPEEPIDFQVLIQEVYDELTIPFMNDIRSNIIFPHSISNIAITWESSNLDVITNDGVVSRDENDDIHVGITATLTKAGYTLVKDFEVIVKSLQSVVLFNQSDYSLSGFALGNISIPMLSEGQPGYYVVYNELDLMNAINAENSSSNGTTAARIIEIRADLNMGYLEVTNQYGILRNFESHITPKMHPILKVSGVGKIIIQDRDGSTSKYNEGLVIFSTSGHTIKHASFSIKRSNNIVIRNLKFDELWEWDEATKGDYDSNDWDYFTLDTIDGIWFDHIELGKSYDGLIDFKAGSDLDATVKNATFSYMKLVFEPNLFIQAQFDYLETNKTSYNYYNQMRIAGMTQQEIMEINSFQKKGFLLGGSELRVGNVFTLTIYNSIIKNLQDRFPRLRGGDVHLFNNIYDATDVYESRNYVLEHFPALFAQDIYKRQLTNQMIVTTEGGAVLLENSIVMGVTQVIKSNQVSSDHPLMTGKYKVIDSMYILGDYVFYGSSEDEDTPFIRSNSEPILPFSWTNIVELPYTNYQLVPVNVLEEYLDFAILGTTDLLFNWLALNY
ncbi:MAG: InlB B-repeat-containing protein [Acholeplasmataceae bacterium]|nr:InlB B-repeat-containing protein [Acholeplasmataceae bacterium]